MYLYKPRIFSRTITDHEDSPAEDPQVLRDEEEEVFSPEDEKEEHEKEED